MAHFKKRKPPRKRKWVDWFFRNGVEWHGHETWQKWKLRYVSAAPTNEREEVP